MRTSSEDWRGADSALGPSPLLVTADGRPVRRNFDADGGPLVGEVTGAGRTMVFLHAGVADRRMWRRQMASVPGQKRVSYDLRGFGESQVPTSTYDHVRDLQAVLAQLEAPAIVVGCSLGGEVALDLALAHSGSVAALVLVSSSVSGARLEPPPVVAELRSAVERGDIVTASVIAVEHWVLGGGRPIGSVDASTSALMLAMADGVLRREMNDDVNAHDRGLQGQRIGHVAVSHLHEGSLSRGQSATDLLPGCP